jgi:hypothetical protein
MRCWKGFRYSVTHANARGGTDMRGSLAATRAVFGRTAYFRVTPAYPLDFFDAVRLATLSTKDEGRSVSVGTPWTDYGTTRTAAASFRSRHRSRWAASDGITGKWQDHRRRAVPHLQNVGRPDYGDHGFVYMSRELANARLNINGTAAYTLTNVMPSDIGA